MRINSSIASNYHSINFKNSTIVEKQNSKDKGYYFTNTFSTQDLFIDQDLSKEQAMQRVKESKFVNISKDEDGTITFDRQLLSEEEVLALRESDLENMGINWGALELQLASGRASYSSMDQVVYSVDYFASEYAEHASQINMRYAGPEQVDQLERLDNMFDSYIQKYANEFADMAGDFFAENDIEINQTQFKDTITEFFIQRKNDYTSFINENDNYAGVKGTEDEWLLSDVQYMSAQLRYNFTKEHEEVNFTSSSGMNLDDLAAIGTMVKETKYVGTGSIYNNQKSEEEFGVELGLTAMKYTLLTENYNLSSPIKGQLDRAFENFLKDQNDKASNYVREMQNDPFVRDKESYAVDWNKEHVTNIINKMIENLKTTDMNKSFKQDIDILFELYKTKANSGETSGLSRYHDSYNSWKESQYVDDWNRFLVGLSLQAGSDLNNYILNNQIDLFSVRI